MSLSSTCIYDLLASTASEASRNFRTKNIQKFSKYTLLVEGDLYVIYPATSRTFHKFIKTLIKTRREMREKLEAG